MLAQVLQFQAPGLRLAQPLLSQASRGMKKMGVSVSQSLYFQINKPVNNCLKVQGKIE